MKYTYDDKNKILTLDGEGSLVISKNHEYGIYLNDEIISTDDFKTKFINHYLIHVKGKFKNKWACSLLALKYIWKGGNHNQRS